MGADLKDYLTGEERRQMDALLAKAEKRMKEKGEDGCSEQILSTCAVGFFNNKGNFRHTDLKVCLQIL